MAKLSKRGISTIGTGAVLLPLLEGFAHLGPTGMFIAGVGTLIAYRHGEQLLDGGAMLADNLIIVPEKKRNFTERMLGLNKEGDAEVQDTASELSILIGFNRHGKSVRKSMQHIKSILILGAAGMGKSTTACYLLGQMIEQGAHISVIDKHARSDESLSAMLSPFEAAFIQSPVYQPDGAMSVAGYASAELSGRIEGERSCSSPYILVIDEFSDIMRQAKQSGPWSKAAQGLVSVVEEFVTGGRKYNCFVLCIGQIVNASRTGGTEIRELFNTRIIHGMKESQASMILSKQFKNQCTNLEPGQIILDIEGKEDPFFVQVPVMTNQDVDRIAASIKQLPGSGGSASTQNMSFQAQNSRFTREAEAEAIPNFQGSDTTSALRSIAKRVRSGESLASIRKDYDLPDSGRALQDVNESLRYIGENFADEGESND